MEDKKKARTKVEKIEIEIELIWNIFCSTLPNFFRPFNSRNDRQLNLFQVGKSFTVSEVEKLLYLTIIETPEKNFM